VRKLKDARKIANLELMRAMEEATKKAVSLKEELTRTERERKEGVAALKEAREALGQAEPQLESLRGELARAQGEVTLLQAQLGDPRREAEAAGLRQRNVELEQELARVRATVDAQAARDVDTGGMPGGPVLAELERIGSALAGEAARLGGIEARLRRATQSLAATNMEPVQ
jgi:chromosome segregation ATPase